MEKLIEQGLLFDFYGELLTDHQRQIYGAWAYDDLSLSELAEDFSISRQGVHDLIKRCDRILTGYEEKLHLIEKFMAIKKTVKEIELISIQPEVKQLANQILEEL